MSELTSWQLPHLKAMQVYSLAKQANWLMKDAEAQLSAFIAQGFPTRQIEQWKYTSTAVLQEQNFFMANENKSEPSKQKIKLDAYRIPNTYAMVFVNGYFAPELSDLGDLPDAAVVTNLATALQRHELLCQEILQTEQEHSQLTSSFYALNGALLTDGLFISLPPNLELNKPIHFLYINSGEKSGLMQHPRHILSLGENSKLTFFVEYIGLGTQSYFNNEVTQIDLAQGSQLHYYKLQRENNAAFHIAHLQMKQQQNSEFMSYHVALGAKLSRDDWSIRLQAPGATCRLYGFYHPQNGQHIDIHSQIDHRCARTKSFQHYRGILADHARAVFNGKVIVQAGSGQVVAQQSNHNLLLGKNSEIDTKPELEIYADDIKCTHGATVGQLDEKTLFYLRSRGIDEADAKGMLTQAFAEEIFSQMPDNAITQQLQQHTMQKLLAGEE